MGVKSVYIHNTYNDIYTSYMHIEEDYAFKASFTIYVMLMCENVIEKDLIIRFTFIYFQLHYTIFTNTVSNVYKKLIIIV